MTPHLQDLQRLLGGACLTEEAPRLARVRDTWPQSFSWPQEKVLSREPIAVALPEDEK
jgi:hypothetical protein